MVPLLSDENYSGPILRALHQKEPALDLIRVQDVELTGTRDPIILEWAADRGRILLSHDRQTVPHFAYERVRQEQAMPGVIITEQHVVPGRMADRLLEVIATYDRDTFANRVLFLSDR